MIHLCTVVSPQIRYGFCIVYTLCVAAMQNDPRVATSIHHGLRPLCQAFAENFSAADLGPHRTMIAFEWNEKSIEARQSFCNGDHLYQGPRMDPRFVERLKVVLIPISSVKIHVIELTGQYWSSDYPSSSSESGELFAQG